MGVRRWWGWEGKGRGGKGGEVWGRGLNRDGIGEGVWQEKKGVRENTRIRSSTRREGGGLRQVSSSAGQ